MKLEEFKDELNLAKELENRYNLTNYESIKLACELIKTWHIQSISDTLSPDLKYSFASTLFDLLESK